MTSSRRRFGIYVCLCVVTMVCVGQLGFWSFRADRFQFQWVVKHVSDSTTSSLTSSPTNSLTSAPTTKAPTSNPTSAPTKAPTNAPTASRTTRTGGYDNDDGCQLTSHSKHIHWARKTENENSYSSSSAAAADGLSADAAVQERIRQVHQCTTKFTWTYVWTPSDSDWWSYLKCNISVTTELIQALVQKHNHILFVGDSVMHQQYVLFLCMMDPMIDRTQVTEGKVHRYDYQRPDGGITTLLYESFGRGWPHAINSLYEDSFPKAIESYTEQDAIVVNANSHYETTKVQLLIDDIRFISQQAARSNASVYLMEPHAEEWPTGNGIFFRNCERSCRCAALTAERLQGHVPYPEIIQRLLVDSSSSPTAAASAESAGTTIQEEPTTTMTTTNLMTGHIPPFWDDLLQFLQERNSHQGDAEVNTNQIDPNNYDMVNNAPCAQECLPATWRTEVVRAILLNQTSPRNNNNNNEDDDAMVASDTRQSNSSTTTTTKAADVHLVPTFLQLATHRGHSAWKSSTDCTHRALDAVIMLNEQLIRTMLKKVNYHHPIAATTIMSSSDRSMMPLPVADYST